MSLLQESKIHRQKKAVINEAKERKNMTNQNQAVDQGFLLLLLLCYFSPIIDELVKSSPMPPCGIIMASNLH